MERHLVRIANTRKYRPEQIVKVASDFEKTARDLEISLKNFRISEIAIEFDLFARDKSLVKKAIKQFVKHGALLSERDLNEDTLKQSKQETVRAVVKLFNEQRYWECHEVMEGVWRPEKDPVEKKAQQGVILAVSALVHAQKNEPSVCLGMIPRTLDKLDSWKEEYYYGMNLDLLKRFLGGMLERKEVSFPKI